MGVVPGRGGNPAVASFWMALTGPVPRLCVAVWWAGHTGAATGCDGLRRRDARCAPPRQAADFTFTLRSLFFASGVFGKVTVNTPLVKSAEIASALMPEGRDSLRWNAP